MSDSWCKPYRYAGKLLHGGAARNARIAEAGGVEQICLDVAHRAAFMALEAIGGGGKNTPGNKSQLRDLMPKSESTFTETRGSRLH